MFSMHPPEKTNLAGTKKWGGPKFPGDMQTWKNHHSDASWFSVINSVIKNSTHTPNLRRSNHIASQIGMSFLEKKRLTWNPQFV